MRIAVALVLTLSVARADTTNRNLLPIGEAESLRSNAGIAGASPGSVFHNPAGLAHVTHPQLAVSGTTLMYFLSSTDRLLQLDEAVGYEASGFAPIPASLISTYKIGSIALATAILVPDLFTIDNRQRRETATSELTIAQSIRRQDLWLGVTAARAFGERVSVGISAFGVRRTAISNTFFQLTVPGTDILTQSTANETSTITGLAAILGLQVQATSWLTVGLRIEPPFLQLASSASFYRSSLTNDGTGLVIEEVDEEGVAIDQPIPPDVGIGLAIRASDALTIYLDAAVQLPADYVYVDEPALGPPTRVELAAAFRSSIGFDLHATEKLMLHGGLQYNGSAQERVAEPGESKEDFYGVSLGATLLGKRSRTGLGVFAQRSRGELVPIGAMPGDTEEAHTTALGALITVGYLL